MLRTRLSLVTPWLLLAACTIDTSGIPVLKPGEGVGGTDSGVDGGRVRIEPPDSGRDVVVEDPDSGPPDQDACVAIPCFADADGDGEGDPNDMLQACECPADYVTNSDDCDDTCDTCNANGLETCNGLNDDCDQATDEGLTVDRYRDADGDMRGDGALGLLPVCPDAVGYADNDLDCNDDNADAYPGAAELCDGVDNDCNDAIDDSVVWVDWYEDLDGDSYGDPNSTPVNDCAPQAGRSQRATDCDDTQGAINPGAAEICDNVDNNCDMATDEALTRACGVCTPGTETCVAGSWEGCTGTGNQMLFPDADMDGYGDMQAGRLACPGAGLTVDNSDCNDTCPTCWIGASELCDSADNDCNSATPDGSGDAARYMAKCDSGDSDLCADDNNECMGGTWTCTDPNGNAVETCNNMDDDCNGVIDGIMRSCGTCTAGAQTCTAGNWSTCTGTDPYPRYPDADGDGRGDASATPTNACPENLAWADLPDDCNDACNTCWTNAQEQCDSIDHDCDGTTGEDVTYYNWYLDNDGDTFGASGSSPTNDCKAPSANHVTNHSDCNDGNPAVRPGATEICDNVDNNCAGGVDESLSRACGSCTMGTENCQAGAWVNCSGTYPQMLHADNDGDGRGFGSPQLVCPSSAWVGNSNDCDDSCNTCWTGHAEVCDGNDNDCDGATIDGASETWVGQACDSVDSDLCTDDSYRCVGAAQSCVDTAASRNELCDGMDNDCDGNTDENLSRACGTCTVGTEVCQNGSWVNCSGTYPQTLYADSDGDTRGGGSPMTACPGVGLVANNNDCNDACNTCWTGHAETCDGRDNDCMPGTLDGEDEGWYGNACDSTDADLCTDDAYTCSGGAQQCADTVNNRAEDCDNVDDDCDGNVDETLSRSCGTCSVGMEVCQTGSWINCTGTFNQTLYADNDGDGRGGGSPMSTCPGAGLVANNNDCNDSCPTCWTGHAETCDGLDNDCSSSTADGVSEAWLGQPCDSTDTDLCLDDSYACSGGSQTCVNVGASRVEDCDNVDDDCDGKTDEALTRSCGSCNVGSETCVTGGWVNCTGTFPISQYVDNDLDGFGDSSLSTQQRCAGTSGYATNGGDCDDSCNSCRPTNTTDTTCDGKDQDCDIAIDEDVNFDSNSNCGACGLTCSGGLTCINQTCADPTSVQQISVGGFTSCALRYNGELLCWGDNYFGQVGVGSTSTADYAVPQVVSGYAFDFVDAGPEHMCGFGRPSGSSAAKTVYCWGHHADARLGLSATGSTCMGGTCITTPTSTGLASVVDLCAGGRHSCAAMSNGRVRCWGARGDGQMGDGSSSGTTVSSVEVRTSAAAFLTGIVEVSCGDLHTCGRTAAGAVYCWGDNSALQTGRTGTSDTLYAATPGGTSGLAFTKLALGRAFSCALRNNGQAYCWGENNDGELGRNSTGASQSTAAGVNFFGTVSDIAAGADHACMVGLVSSTPQLLCWGSNVSGQVLSPAGASDVLSPSLIASGGSQPTAVGVSSGSRHNCALQSTSTPVVCWGKGDYGELGDGTRTTTPATRTVACPLQGAACP